jgi:hypothetical protein
VAGHRWCFLLHVLPDGFHRIRHYGLLASATRKANIAKIRTCSKRRALSRMLYKRPRSRHSPCANHVPAAAARCASSRSSGAVRNQCLERHRGSRQHDPTPGHRIDEPPDLSPVPVRTPFAKCADLHTDTTCDPWSSNVPAGHAPEASGKWIRDPSRLTQVATTVPTVRTLSPEIDPRPPRLPPSEVCQRSPPACGRQTCAAACIEKPAGKPTFTAVAINRGLRPQADLESTQTTEEARQLRVYQPQYNDAEDCEQAYAKVEAADAAQRQSVWSWRRDSEAVSTTKLFMVP